MKNSIIMHINYMEVSGGSFGKRSIDDVCRYAAELGYNGIEFRGEAPKDLGISFREYAEQIAAGKKNHGLTDILFSFDVRDCANPDKSARDAIIAKTLEKTKIAREVCDTKVCNTSCNWISSPVPGVPGDSYHFHGSIVAKDKDWELTTDTYQKIGVELETIGLKLAFETHMGYIHDLPATARRLVDLIDNPMVGINLDYGNTVYFPVRPSLEEAIDQCGDKLFHLHLKNSTAIPGSEKRLATSLGDGEINHRTYLQKLIDVGYTGTISIEAPRPGDRPTFAKQDAAYLQSVIADLS